MNTFSPSPHEEIEHLLMLLLRSVLDDAETVEIETLFNETSIMFRVNTRSQDTVAKLIGRRGRMAQSIRTIIGSASMKAHSRCTVEIDNMLA